MISVRFRIVDRFIIAACAQRDMSAALTALDLRLEHHATRRGGATNAAMSDLHTVAGLPSGYSSPHDREQSSFALHWVSECHACHAMLLPYAMASWHDGSCSVLLFKIMALVSQPQSLIGVPGTIQTDRDIASRQYGYWASYGSKISHTSTRFSQGR